MNDPKQVILVRTDIKMPKGKLAAQVAHASMSPLLHMFREGYIETYLDEEDVTKFRSMTPCVDQWLNGSFTKVCLRVSSLEEIREYYESAKKAGIPTSIIVDEGRTCFSEPTTTCCSIGPFWSDEIDLITGNLKLL